MKKVHAKKAHAKAGLLFPETVEKVCNVSNSNQNKDSEKCPENIQAHSQVTQEKD